jgi:hypothetical protein
MEEDRVSFKTALWSKFGQRQHSQKQILANLFLSTINFMLSYSLRCLPA